MKMGTQLLTIVMLMALGIGPVSAAPPENASEVISHLEFLGYDVSMDAEHIIAKHSENMNVLIKKYRSGMLFTSYYGGSEYGRNNIDSWLILVNQLNQKAAAARYYIDGDGDLTLEAYYPGDYNKKSFSAFLDSYNIESYHLAEIIDEIEKYLE